ncbi:alpha/beta fold hydrolase [Luteimonas mephitis]|uniref:alpha/beta fold hydrolase n=1 Tax=Luteimonas mephitis TaxID=83615 RepID=UPI0003F91F12|nr:alpha/beta fold hydrolase [Luteimonas mephitis]
MPGWQTVLIVAALVAAAFVLAAAWRLWRDPYALIRAEFARERMAAGLARRVVDVDGLRWVYAEGQARDADAPVLVMLHGFTGSKENWYPVARRLRGRYRLLLPDLPGWGESTREGVAGHGFAAQAARVAAFIRATCDRPVVLLGHSMGGGIAAVLAAREPGLVARVGLFNAAGVRFADNQFGLDVLAGGNPFGVHDHASLAHYLDILFHDRRALPALPWPAPAILIAQRRRDAAFEQTVLDEIGRGPEQFLPGDEAARIRQPALLAWGAHDKVIDPSAMDLYAAAIPQAVKVLLDGSGHMTVMEQPDAIVDAIEGLLAAAPFEQGAHA